MKHIMKIYQQYNLSYPKHDIEIFYSKFFQVSRKLQFSSLNFSTIEPFSFQIIGSFKGAGKAQIDQILSFCEAQAAQILFPKPLAKQLTEQLIFET